MDEEKTIVKIMEIKSRERLALPKEARELLNVKEGDYVAFVKECSQPGLRIIRVDLFGGNK